MTSLAFILGVVPLVASTGAGAEGRRSIGTGVFGGMLAATVLAVFFVPLFFVLIQGASEWVARRTWPAGAAAGNVGDPIRPDELHPRDASNLPPNGDGHGGGGGSTAAAGGH
jgi:hypothetical protein